MIDSVIKPLRPLRQGRTQWQEREVDLRYHRGYPVERWFHITTDIQVLTAVEVAHEKDGTTPGPEYHLSMSRAIFLPQFTIERIDTESAKWVLAEFGLNGALEDNHVPFGKVRNFWRPVAEPLVGRECPCNAEEVVIRENRGDFVWRP